MSDLELLFNELSLAPKQTFAASERPSNHDAAGWIRDFVQMLSAFYEAWKEVFRFRSCVFLPQEEVIEGYMFSDWLANAPQTEKVFFLSLITQMPLYKEEELPFQEKHLQTEVLFQGRSGEGLRASYVLGGIAVSLPSREEWRTPKLPVLVQELEETGIKEFEKDLLHASSSDHVESHQSEIQRRFRAAPQDGKAFWAAKKDTLPFLRFSPSTQTALEGLAGRPFQQIFKRLCSLNRYASLRPAGSFNTKEPSLGNASDESESRKQSYPLLFRFSDEDGVPHSCFFHLKFGNGTRIHLCPLEGVKEIFVGYIGPHL